jgi:hypothetical protein
VKLFPCPKCARHVREDEHACPFCSAAVACSGRCIAATPDRAASRAAILFVGATAIAGCGKTNADHLETSGGVVAPYAAAPVDAAPMPMIEPADVLDAGVKPVAPPVAPSAKK